MKVSWRPVRARLRAPFEAAWGSVVERELVLASLEEDGEVGHGEAAPLPGYGLGDSDAAARAAALDLARCDLKGRRAGIPVWKLLGAEAPGEVGLNALVGGADDALEAVRAGFSCVKVKVGLADDLKRVAAVRAAVGPDVAVRVDANGAWSVHEALAALEELSQFAIELCEEPVHGLEQIALVAAGSPVPVALDESGSLAGAFDRRVCDAVCLKVARCGGITGLVADAARARAAGYRVYLASTLDGPLGIAAALHAAAVVRPDLPCGLATLSLFERPHPLATVGGSASPPRGPGLGDGLLDWYR